jgi:hypothetical protein
MRSGGFLSRLSGEELRLYVFLSLAADARGLSCWRLDRMERELSLDVAALRRARDGLIRADLLAYKPWSVQCPDGSYQVLALPAPVMSAAQGCASIGQCLSSVGVVKR